MTITAAAAVNTESIADFAGELTESKMENGVAQFDIELKYSDNTPVIRTIERVSRPGRRVYASVKNIPSVANGLGVSILSTPKGVMADHEAKAQNLGGEVLCRVF